MKLDKLFKLAEKKEVAIGHFNVSNLETFEAVVIASKKTRTPVIIGVSEGAIHHASVDFFIWAKNFFQGKYGIELFLHLDHGRDIDLILECIDKGFDSVMIDMSHEKFERNVSLTKYIVKKAHRNGVWVEAEIGRIGGAEESAISKKIVYTNPVEAYEFVKRTGCDSLAVAIGTSHGPNKFIKKSNLNFEVLKKVKHLINVPLVLHGASMINPKTARQLSKYGFNLKNAVGVSDEDIKKAIKFGIRKINIDTDLQLSLMNGFIKNIKENPKEYRFYKILEKASVVLTEEVIGKIKLFSKK
ncbi:MAG: class II fructose-bisphosphate aldolase [Patescibacteria group bacterium]|nr:class II fructose-bisphosphate aldolase [Patescibacteria group bacterium]